MGEKTAEDWWKVAYEHSTAGRFQEAITCYDKALELDPKHKMLWNNKGKLLYNKFKKHYEALECWEKAIEIDPAYSDAWYNKGNAFFALKKYEEAIICYKKALEFNPDDDLAAKYLRETKEKLQSIVVFISYSVKNSQEFSIREVAKSLATKPAINKVYCWELWSGYPNGSITSFMNEGIEECAVFLPFFTPDYRQSKNCMKEYESADAMNRPMIPMFNDFEQVPPLCRSKLGFNFRSKEFSALIDELYERILAIT